MRTHYARHDRCEGFLIYIFDAFARFPPTPPSHRPPMAFAPWVALRLSKASVVFPGDTARYPFPHEPLPNVSPFAGRKVGTEQQCFPLWTTLLRVQSLHELVDSVDKEAEMPSAVADHFAIF